MHPSAVMLETVKNYMSSIGDNTGDFARRMGGSTADIAKRVGGSTADLARRVGPKRGIIGLVVLAAAVGGGIYLVRYLRARAEDEETIEGEEDLAGGTKRARKLSRAQRKANHVVATH